MNSVTNDKSLLQIRQVMTTDVECVHPNDTMAKVIELFNYNDFHHVPVLDEDGTVVGIISKSECYKIQHTFTLFKRADANRHNQAIYNSLLVEEVMQKQIVTLHPEDTIQKAVGYFLENRFRAIPIVDEDDRLVGILTTYDLLACIG